MKLQKNKLTQVLALTMAIVPGVQSVALAANSVNAQTLTPSLGLNYFMTETAIPEYAVDGKMEGYRRYFLNVSYNTLSDALVQLDPTRTTRQATIISRLHTLDLGAGIEWDGDYALGLNLPLDLVVRPGQANAFALGDSRVFGKIFLTRDKKAVNWALVPELRLPTGSRSLFTSEATLGAGLLVAAEYDFGRMKVGANAGLRYTPGAYYQNMDYKYRLPLSLGVTAPLSERWWINGELMGALTLPIDRYNNPGEGYVGLRYFARRNFVFHTGVGVGDFSGTGSGDFRFSLGMKFAPSESDEVVVAAKPAPAPSPAPVVQTVKVKRVVFTPKEIKISEEVKFEHNKDVLTQSGRNLLDEVAQVIKANLRNFKKIRIEGHANELGTDAYNLDLSRRRALAVREYLSSRGVDRTLLLTAGYGERRPKPESKFLSREAALNMNRRVEFKVFNAKEAAAAARESALEEVRFEDGKASPAQQ